MEKSFAIIELMKDYKEPLLRKIRKSYLPKKFFIKRVLDKAPISKEKIYVGGVKGYRVAFPLIEDYLESLTSNEIEKLASQIIIKMELEGTNTYVISERIKRYFKDEIMICDGKALKILLLDQILDYSLDYLNVTYENAKIAISDSNNDLAKLAITVLYKKVKSLVLITDRPDYFEEIRKKCKSEEELEIEVIDTCYRYKLDVDILIQLSDELDKKYQLLKKGSVVINILSDCKQTKIVLLKRGDLNVIDNIDVMINDSVIDLPTIQAAIFSENRGFRNFVNSGYNEINIEKLIVEIKKYNLKICSLLQFGKSLRKH